MSIDASSTSKYLLDIQVLDPAMGSGHFLVVAVDEITKWIMSLLQRYPDAPLAEEIGRDRSKIISEQKKRDIILEEELLTFNVILKRKVMKRCVYGVDVNPLAVELAKLSLWLDSFTIGSPLTFLDHHIRCGDSLIGLWKENLDDIKKENLSGNLSLDFWTNNIQSMGDTLAGISTPTDLSLADFKRNKENYTEFREKSNSLRRILDMHTAAIMDRKLQESLPKNLSLVEETIRKDKLEQASWSKPVLESISYSEKYHFFHWELEFPDAYTDERRGFDLVVMNPPWDAIRPYDDDFFSSHYPPFRKIATKSEKAKQKTKLLKQGSIASSYSTYVSSIQQKLMFIKSSGQFGKRSSKGIAFDS